MGVCICVCHTRYNIVVPAPMFIEPQTLCPNEPSTSQSMCQVSYTPFKRLSTCLYIVSYFMCQNFTQKNGTSTPSLRVHRRKIASAGDRIRLLENFSEEFLPSKWLFLREFWYVFYATQSTTKSSQRMALQPSPDLSSTSINSRSTSSAEQRTSRRNPGSVQNAMKLNL